MNTFYFALYRLIDTALDLDEPLDDKQLFDVCLSADPSGSLNVMIQHRACPQRPSGENFTTSQSLVVHGASPLKQCSIPSMQRNPGGLNNGTSDSRSSHHQLPSVLPLHIDYTSICGNITPTPPSYSYSSLSLSNSRDGLAAATVLAPMTGRSARPARAPRLPPSVNAYP